MICVASAGTVAVTWTAKVTVCDGAAAANAPMLKVAVLPTSVQPGVLLPGTKTVFAGTVSVMNAPAAFWLPTFWQVMT